MAPSLLEIAEAPGAYVEPRHPHVVVGDGWVFVPLSPALAAVQRIRLGDDQLDSVQAQVRDLATKHNIPEVGWFQSELARPADIGSRLGLERRETLTVLALTQPFDAEGGFTVRQVETFDDYVAAQRIDAIANGWPVGDRDGYARLWEAARTRFLLWLALDGDEPVGMARCAVAGEALVMIGGSVLPEARGRGAYRSLVAERWRCVEHRGLKGLVTSANDQSGPILSRLGFERLGEIEVWVDRL